MKRLIAYCGFTRNNLRTEAMCKTVETDDRCINVPSWSLPMKMIIDIERVAKERKVSQSSILREALEERLKIYTNPIQEAH